MSVFTADTQSGHWPGFIGTSPFGWDSLHSSSPFRGFRSGLGLFDDDQDKDDTKPSKMRLRSTGPTLGQRGFYEHFSDNVFRHDHRRCDAASADSSKRQSESTGRGKEYVIPIKIERVSSSSDNSKPNTRSLATVAKSSPSPSAKATSASSTSSRPGTIEIPIFRETASDSRKAVNRSTGRDNKPAFSVPSSHFKLLTPTTEQGHRRGIHDPPSKNGDIVYMDYEDFFPSKPSSQNSDNCDVVEIEEEEDETVTTTRRKSPRHSSNAAGAAVTSKKPAPSSRTESTSSPQSSASSSNIRSAENVTIIDIKSPERSREAVVKKAAAPASQERKGACSAGSSGTIEVTPTPSYPVYDYLKPRLASIERQLDYIRGDGNCFFRALSKEMYGSEDFHAEWRQAVVDVIESHPHVFRQYIDGENVQEHVADMRRAGTWATTCEIYAAATLLQREIYVLAPNPTGHEYSWLLFSPRALPGASSSSSTHQSTAAPSSHGQAAEVHPCYLTLCYTNGNHYDRITPVFAHCNCEMAPPCLSGLSLLVDLTDEDGRKMEIK